MKKIFLLSSLIIYAFFASAQTGRDVPVSVTISETTGTTVKVEFEKSEDCNYYFILIGEGPEIEDYAVMMDKTMEEMIEWWGLQLNVDTVYTWKDLIPNTEYNIYVLASDFSENYFPIQNLTCQTAAIGGEGVAQQNITVTEITAIQARVIVEPNEETAMFFDGLIMKDFYDEVGADSALAIIKESPYELYETDDWLWMDLDPDTYYYAIAVGKNINGEWGTPSIELFKTLQTTGLCKPIDDPMISLYPNPNQGSFIVNNANSEVENMEIYDMKGKLIYAQKLSGTISFINVLQLEEAIYFVKFINKSGHCYTEKLIITK